jgi:hypothetical protein
MTRLGFEIPVTLRTVGLAASEAELEKALHDAQGLSLVQMEWIRDELGKRLIRRQIEATSEVVKAVETLTQSSSKLESLTSTLITETANVHNQVVILTGSSRNIERLTKWLIGLTVVLGVLTFVLALDVGLKYAPDHLQLTSPQTPSLPAPR